MDLRPPPRLPANLESAVQRVRMAARTAAEHTVDSLGLAALATHQVLARDALLGAQYELNRKLAIFALTFNEALDTDVARQAGTLIPTPGPAVTADGLVASWEGLTLVDDHEVEIHISADRFAQEIAHACEWEIRELDAYMGTLLGLGAADHGRNPLRAEVVGQAMVRAIESVSDRPEVRKVLCTEIGRSLAHAMRQTYGEMVADMRQAGVRPVGLTVRHAPMHGHSGYGGLTGSARQDGASTGPGRAPASAQGRLQGVPDTGLGHSSYASHGRHSGYSGQHTGQHSTHSSSTHSSSAHSTARGSGPATLGRVDNEMMALIRRLAQGSAGGAADAGDPDNDDPPHGSHHGHGYGAPNVILANRDTLRRAATGTLDHRVIDVIASLFDQILSDNKVPPQIVRLIARLQLPVLRAALGDNSFFSSHRHPVRLLVNRIASLGSAVDDFDDAEGRALLAQVAGLVQELVDGDFEQIAVYEQKLAALETFIAEQSQQRVRALGAADTLLAQKEDSLRVHQQHSQELQATLQGLPVPDYLCDFLAQVWSRAITNAALTDGHDSALAQRLRDAGRELVISVQPKGSPERRQQFLRKLPHLMKDLNMGLERIAYPEAQRRAFFARLLPAHAESLKGQAPSTLAHNLLVRHIDNALAMPIPASAALATTQTSTDQAALQALATPQVFTAAEAQAVGLVDEAAVDWSTPVCNTAGPGTTLAVAWGSGAAKAAGNSSNDGSNDGSDGGNDAELTAVDISIEGLPTPEAIAPTRGKSLAEHLQIGQAYQLLLQGDWQKVRLSYVSAARSFYVFTHGAKQRGTVSMTHRMVLRLCEAGRLRAVENAYLLERATARARRQLAEMAPPRSAYGASPPRSANGASPPLSANGASPPLSANGTSPPPSAYGAAAQGSAASGPAEPVLRRPLGGLFNRRG